MKRAGALYQLQTVEASIDLKSQRLTEMETQLGDDDVIQAVQSVVEQMEERLKKDGFNVVSANVVPLVCNIDAVKRRTYEADYLVVLACDSGVFTVQSIFPDKVVVPALNTIGLGAKDSNGNIFVMKKF